MCTPPGQEEFFMAVGDRIASRTTPPPALSPAERAARLELVKTLAPRYRTQMLG